MKRIFLGLSLAAACTMASAQQLSQLGIESNANPTNSLLLPHKVQPKAHTTIQTPSGEISTYSMGGIFSNYLGGFNIDGLQQTIYFDTDDATGETTVWFQNFFPLQLDNAWTHGTLKDGKVSIPVQRIYDYDNYGDGTDIRPLSIAMLKTEGKADETTGEQKQVVGYEDAFELIYTDGHFEMPDPDRLIGLVQFNEDGTMSLYSYTKELVMDYLADAVPVNVPEGAEAEQYIYYFSTSDGYYTYNDLNDVVIDGQDIYFNNLCPDYPDVWVKGSLSTDADGNITGATVPSGQFLSYNIAYLLYFTAQKATGEFTAKGAPITTPIDAATFTYDATTKTFTMNSDEFVSETTMNGTTKGIYGNISVKYHGEDVPAVPSDPHSLELLDLSAYGYGVMVSFDIDNVGTQGEYLNPNKLFWQVLIDGKLLEFTADEYPEDIEDEPMTQIPYYFNGYYDLGYGDSPTQRFYVFYRDTWKRAGVQAVYTVDDVTFRSNIVYINADQKITKVPDGINTVLSPTATSTAIYDLGGRLYDWHSTNAHTGHSSRSVYIKGGRKYMK